MLRRSQAEQTHYEHQILIDELDALERALDGLVCHSEIYADLSTAELVYRCSRNLYDSMPTHFAREEQTILQRVALLAPEWADFAREMRIEHLQLQGRLEALLAAIHVLARTQDLEPAMAQVKQRGHELARDLKLHLTAEERRLNTISTYS